MIRSNYVIPRLALFVLCVGFSTLALNPLVRWGIARTGQSITGARVDIARVRSALVKGYVTLEDVRASDPRQPMKNLFEAQHVHLSVDTEALRQRRFVITEAKATGFRLGTARAVPGALAATADAVGAESLAAQFAFHGKPWLQDAARIIYADVTDDLPSVEISRQLSSRWPTEQEQIVAHSAYVRGRIARVQKLIDDSGENPLRNLQPYQQAIEELEGLQREALEITGGMNRLRQQLLMDQNAIREARQQDEVFLDQQRQMGILSGEQLSEYLMGPELNEQIGEILDWVRWGRKQIPTGVGIPLAHRGRGEFLYFPGIELAPVTVVQQLTFVGSGVFGGEVVELEGVVRGLSSHPELSTEPVALLIKTAGGMALQIQASLDLHGNSPHDHVLVSCPNWPCQRRALGQTDKLAVDVSPGTADMRVCLEIVGDAVEGEVTLKQQSVVLTPRLAASIAGEKFSQLIASSLDGIHEFETRAKLTGTIDRPVCDLKSNLGPSLASGIALVVDDAARACQRRALAAKYREIDAMIDQLDQLLEQKNQELLAQFKTSSDQIERIKEIIATRVERTDGVTDQHWPLREKFLR